MTTTTEIIRRLGKLKSVLLKSGIQKENQPLYQVINQLIDAIIASNQGVIELNDETGESIPSIAFITQAELLTAADETTNFPNSRELLAGTGVTFDDSVSGERTINAAASDPDYYDSPLTDGDPDETDLIFADGECVIVQVPNP